MFSSLQVYQTYITKSEVEAKSVHAEKPAGIVAGSTATNSALSVARLVLVNRSVMQKNERHRSNEAGKIEVVLVNLLRNLDTSSGTKGFFDVAVNCKLSGGQCSHHE